MNITNLVFLLLVVLGTALHPLAGYGGDEDMQTEQIIQSFMDSQGMDIQPRTEEYEML